MFSELPLSAGSLSDNIQNVTGTGSITGPASSLAGTGTVTATSNNANSGGWGGYFNRHTPRFNEKHTPTPNLFISGYVGTGSITGPASKINASGQVYKEESIEDVEDILPDFKPVIINGHGTVRSRPASVQANGRVKRVFKGNGNVRPLVEKKKVSGHGQFKMGAFIHGNGTVIDVDMEDAELIAILMELELEEV